MTGEKEQEHGLLADPRGLDELLGCERLSTRRLDLPVADLARVLCRFGHAVAETGTRAARLSQAGRYDSAGVCGSALRVRDDGITVRLHPRRVAAAVAYEAALTAGAGDHVGDGAGAALEFFGDSGDPVHRVRLHATADRMVLDLAGRIERHGDVRTPLEQVGALSAAARSGSWPYRSWSGIPWQDGDQLAQLDAILADGGRSRHAELVESAGGADPDAVVSRAEASIARPFDVSVLPLVFEHLSSVGLPVGIAVFSGCALQAACGPVHAVARAGDGLRILLGSAVLDLDPDAVHEGLVVPAHGPHGPTAALELYDEHGGCLAQLTQFGLVGPQPHAAWQHLTASLPGA